MSEPRAVARAIDALRRGWEVSIGGVDGALTLLAIETADDARLARFDEGAPGDVLLSAARAHTLKLANQRDAADPRQASRIEHAPWLDLAGAVALADPALDLATPLKGPFRAVPVGATEAARAALELARLAGLLPAFFVRDAEIGEEIVDAAAIQRFEAPERLLIAARARLPVEASPRSEIVAFRSLKSSDVHVALLIGEPDGRPPLVRLHSECLTGDVFGSLKCDCGPQSHTALTEIADAGWGILLYLRQEGRGIGLVNKIRAYRLQDQGHDTVDANVRLGFAIDARDFGTAAKMLDLLGQPRIRLLTNNPAKVERLAAAGIEVVERVPHRMSANPHNAAYLAAKRDRTGHQL